MACALGVQLCRNAHTQVCMEGPVALQLTGGGAASQAVVHETWPAPKLWGSPFTAGRHQAPRALGMPPLLSLPHSLPPKRGVCGSASMALGYPLHPHNTPKARMLWHARTKAPRDMAECGLSPSTPPAPSRPSCRARQPEAPT